jgi:transcriptional/translational regulatory protein YebC/TACO1
VSTEGEEIEVTTTPDDFNEVADALEKAGFQSKRAEVTRIPEANVELDHETTTKALRLIEKLDDHDDVKSVSTNLEIPDDFDPEALE